MLTYAFLFVVNSYEKIVFRRGKSKRILRKENRWYLGRGFGLSEAKENVKHTPYTPGVVRPHPTCPKYQKEE